MADLIYYKSDDATGQSQAVMAIARLKYPSATIVDTKEKDNTAMANLVSGLDDDAYDNIVLCMEIVDTHAAGKFTGAQAADLIPKLVTANQGTNVTGSAEANSTKTTIDIEAADAVSENYFNQMLIETTGGTAVARLISDDDGAGALTVTDTGTAITTGDSYTIYTTAYLRLLGETHDTRNPAYHAWNDLYPSNDQIPLVIGILGGNDSLHHKSSETATSAAAGTLTHTSEFTAAAYDGGDYYVAIESATTGGGQIRKITSNTVSVLTLESNWDITPTGTIVYQIVHRTRVLWDFYLPYAVATYLYRDTDAIEAIWSKLLVDQDHDLIAEYVERGKYIAEAVWAGVVS